MQKFSKILLLKLGEKLETMQKRKFCEKKQWQHFSDKVAFIKKD